MRIMQLSSMNTRRVFQVLPDATQPLRVDVSSLGRNGL